MEAGRARRFEGRVALVTGGRCGIGEAIARRLSDEGARVFTAQRGADPEFEGVLLTPRIPTVLPRWSARSSSAPVARLSLP